MNKISNSHNNLHKLKTNIKYIVLITLIISSIIFIIFYYIIWEINQQLNLNTYINIVTNTNKNLQYNLSAQFAIIANNPDFISYIRSGKVTRDKYFSIMRWNFTNFNSKLVKGITINNNINQNIFSYGTKTNLYTTVNICYLGGRINYTLGECHNLMTIYFDVKEYTIQLHNLDTRLNITQKTYNNYEFQPFSSKFGLFNNSNHSKQLLNFAIYHSNQKIFFTTIFYALIIFILCLLIRNHYLNFIFEKQLINSRLV